MHSVRIAGRDSMSNPNEAKAGSTFGRAIGAIRKTTGVRLRGRAANGRSRVLELEADEN